MGLSEGPVSLNNPTRKLNMPKYSSTLLNVAAIIILGSLSLMTGCSSEDPASPVVVSGDGDPVVTPTDEALWESVLKMPDSWWGFDRSSDNLGATKLPFPDSPQQVMENFVTAYETQDVVEYLLIMHPDFQTILQQGTMDEFPDVGPTLDRYEEQNIHKRMFSGLALSDPNGDLVPGISAIVFEVFQPLAPWEDTPNDDIIPNAMYSLYEVQILVDRGQTYSTLRVEGMIKFYVVSREFEHEGSIRHYFQMIGQVDLTDSFKSTESTNWGSIKALFR